MVTHLLSDAARDGHRLGDRLRPDRARPLRRARRPAAAERHEGPAHRRRRLRRLEPARTCSRRTAPRWSRPAHAERRPHRRARACARAVGDAAPDAIVHAAISNDPAGLLRDRRARVGRATSARRATSSTPPTRPAPTSCCLDRLGLRRHAGPGGRGRAAEPGQRVRLPQGGVASSSSPSAPSAARSRGSPACRACTARGRTRRARRTPASATSSPRSSTRCAPGGRSRSGTSPGINTLATPTLATDAGELIWRALERGLTGDLHCVGGEHVDRVELARRAAAAFGLDPRPARRRAAARRAAGGRDPVRHAPRRDARRRPRSASSCPTSTPCSRACAPSSRASRPCA